MISRALWLVILVWVCAGASALFSSPAQADYPTNLATCSNLDGGCPPNGQGTSGQYSVAYFASQCATWNTSPATTFAYLGSNTYQCGYNMPGAYEWFRVNYAGTPTCPSNEVYNSATGQCSVVCTSGQTTTSGTWNLGYNSYAWNSPFNAVDGSGNVITICSTCSAPKTACQNGCQVSYNQTGSAQVTDSYGTVMYSTGSMSQTGLPCQAGDGAAMTPIAQPSGTTTQQAIANNETANAPAVAASSAAATSTAAQQAAVDAGASSTQAAADAQQAAANAAAQAAANSGMANPMIAFCQNDPNALVCQNVNNDVTVADPVLPDVSTMSTLDSTFSPLAGWQVPAHTSTCPQPKVDLSALGLGSFTISAHCDLANQYFPALRSIMAAVFTVLALFIVLRA
jgi:hypothetical protein